MNDKTNKTTSEAIETQVGRKAGFGVMMGEIGKPVVTATGGAAGADAEPKPEDTPEKPEAEEPEEGAGDEAGDGEETADGDAEEAAEGELGDYDPKDADTIAKFEKHYLNEDNSPNLDVIGAEWWANHAKGGEGKLNDATYKFLGDAYGLTKDQVKVLEAGQVALTMQARAALETRAGGKEALDAALAWGKGGGYSKDEAARFNATMNGKDPNAINEAIDALMHRYSKANPPQSRRRIGKPERRVTDKATSAGGPKPIATEQEYREEFSKMRKAGNDEGLKELRRRAKVSPWFTNRKPG